MRKMSELLTLLAKRGAAFAPRNGRTCHATPSFLARLCGPCRCSCLRSEHCQPARSGRRFERGIGPGRARSGRRRSASGLRSSRHRPQLGPFSHRATPVELLHAPQPSPDTRTGDSSRERSQPSFSGFASRPKSGSHSAEPANLAAERPDHRLATTRSDPNSSSAQPLNHRLQQGVLSHLAVLHHDFSPRPIGKIFVVVRGERKMGARAR